MERKWSLDPKDDLYKLDGSTFGVPRKLFEGLYSYQRDAVAWAFTLTSHAPPRLAVQPPRVSHGALASLRAAGEDPSGKGGILADDMGLGKSVQTTALIAGLFHSDMINAALIVAPVSVLPVWEDAFKKFAPELRVRTYHGASVPERVKAMRAVQTKGGVLITSYGMISSDPVAFGGRPVVDDEEGSAGAAAAGGSSAGGAIGAAAGKKGTRKPAATPSDRLGDLDISFDLMVLDEAHTIKNTATKAARALRTVPADFRFLLTGTPIQNNLEELWSLVDFALQGTLLGTRRVFNKEIGDYIVRGRDRLATPTEKAHATAAAQLLTQLVAPYILRREKATVFGTGGPSASGSGTGIGAAAAGGDDAAADAAGEATSSSGAAVPAKMQASPQLSEKKEVVLWTRLSALQLHLYRRFLESAEVAAVLNRTTSPLAAITTLKQLACHPLLLKSVADGTVTIDAASATGAAGGAMAADADGDDDEDDDIVLTGRAAAAAAKAQRKPSAPTITSAEDARLQNLAAQQLDRLRSRSSAAAGSSSSSSSSASSGSLSSYSDFGAFFRAASTEGASSISSSSSSSSSSNGDAGSSVAAASAVGKAGWPGIAGIPAAELVRASGKLQVLVELLRTFQRDGSKALVFSSSLRLLDMVEALLRDFPSACTASEAARRAGASAFASAVGDDSDAAAAAAAPPARPPRYVRIDGSLSDAERRPIVKQFNEDPKLRVCLLTTGVGALGLTLTGADRVIICDPSWNPAVDSQAVDRAFRIGQTRNVVTYRLVAAGTIEEKMYRRQIFKGGLTQSVMAGVMRPGAVGEIADGELTRFLTAAELKDVFTLGATDFSETQRMVDAVCTPPAPRAADLRAHVAALESGPVCQSALGMSHHDHLFSLDPATAKKLQEMAARAKSAAETAALFGGAAAVRRSSAGAGVGAGADANSDSASSSSDSSSDGGDRLSDCADHSAIHLDSPIPSPAPVRRSTGPAGRVVIDLTGVGAAPTGARAAGGTIDLTAAAAGAGAGAGAARALDDDDGKVHLDLDEPEGAYSGRGAADGAASAVAGTSAAGGADAGQDNEEEGSIIDLMDSPPQSPAHAPADAGAARRRSSRGAGAGVAAAGASGAALDGEDHAHADSHAGASDGDGDGYNDDVAEALAGDLSHLSIDAGGSRATAGAGLDVGAGAGAGGSRRSGVSVQVRRSMAMSPGAPATPATEPSQTPPRTAARAAPPAAVEAAGGASAAIGAAAGDDDAVGDDVADFSAFGDENTGPSPASTVRVSICSPPPRTAVRGGGSGLAGTTRARSSVAASSSAGAGAGNGDQDDDGADAGATPGGRSAVSMRTPLSAATPASAHGLAAPPNVCARHWAQVARCGLSSAGIASVEQCECALSPESRELAAMGVEQAQALLKQSAGAGAGAGAASSVTPAAAAEALKLALDALVIRDADPAAHRVAMQAASALGLLGLLRA